MEIKGVTLEEGGIARFPDAPTGRGERHLRELIRAAAGEDIRVYGLSDYRIQRSEKDWPTILLGYANLTEEQIREAAGTLVTLWKSI